LTHNTGIPNTSLDQHAWIVMLAINTSVRRRFPVSLWHDRVEEANFWPDLEEARNLLAETSPDNPEAPAQMDQIGAVLDFAEYRLNIADARLITGSQLSIVNNKMNNIMDHLPTTW
jgi:hypothetical protein